MPVSGGYGRLRSLVRPTELSFLFLSTLVVMGDCEGKMPYCWKRKYYINFMGRAVNATLACPHFYQWSVSEFCCYDGYDRFDMRPFCCHSEIYKLLIAMATICGTVLGVAAFLFLWWYAKVSHHLLKIITCGKFNLNEFVQKRKLTGPYVDPSFYAGEPFWTPGGSEMYPYPLRPMPPRIFYPALPSSYKGLGRWSGSSTRLPHGQIPLFVLASRQFTRKPWSARPRPNQRRSSSSSFNASHAQDGTSSRRSSTSSSALELHNAGRLPPSFTFRVHMDEVEAAAELLEVLQKMEEKGEKAFSIPKLLEETQGDLELENQLTDTAMQEQQARLKEYGHMSGSSRVGLGSSGSVVPTHTRPATSQSFGGRDSVDKYRSSLMSSYAEEEDTTSSDNIPGYIPDTHLTPTFTTADK